MHQSECVYRRSHLLGAARLTKTHATKDPIISNAAQADTTFIFSVIQTKLAVLEGKVHTQSSHNSGIYITPFQRSSAAKLTVVFRAEISFKKKKTFTTGNTSQCVFGLRSCSRSKVARCSLVTRALVAAASMASKPGTHNHFLCCRLHFHLTQEGTQISPLLPVFSSSFAQRG